MFERPQDPPLRGILADAFALPRDSDPRFADLLRRLQTREADAVPAPRPSAAAPRYRG